MRQLLRVLFGEAHFGGFVVERGLNIVSSKTTPVAGDDDWLLFASNIAGRKIEAVVGSGFPEIRKRMMGVVRNAGIPSPVLVHPAAVVERHDVDLAEGVVICAGAVLSTDVAIGGFTLVNWHATIGHDVSVGECSVINPAANVGGNVRIGNGVLIGVGAQILQGLSIGDGAVVGAGAVVTRDVSPGSIVVGVPARRQGA
jgi:sugar O-acyltransferase (sialic acid O-acetyltransferase NeuD family)